MNITENYIGYDALVTYLIESKNYPTYHRFLNLNRDIIISSLNLPTNSSLALNLDKWQYFNITWYKRFLNEVKNLFEPDIFVAVKDKKKNLPETSQSDLPKNKQEVIKECDKKNLVLAEISQPATSLSKKTCKDSIKNLSEPLQPDLQVNKECEKENIILAETSQADVLLSKITVKIPVKNLSEISQSVLPKKKFQFTDFCYDILHELENKSYANLFYKYVEKDFRRI
ncbi:11070_t:CDS:2 [Rhizophagus irregularis]|nr:11070_t:CDS:2 [Rhizophagus irregularis]